MNEKLRELKDWIIESENVVFLGGAGVSTESNIPDFRGSNGIFLRGFDYPPETIVSRSFYNRDPDEFYRFYRSRMVFPNAKPNKAHQILAKLERVGILKAVITQNIDGLHQEAGSKNVLELHGNMHRNYCQNCGKAYGLKKILEAKTVPYCSCGGIIKPDVVLYGESLDENVMQQAIHFIRNADVLVVGGTSLSVYPAAGLIDYYRGSRFIQIDREETAIDERVNLKITGNIGEILGRLFG
ncbi:MAG: NAD-dependent protein deacylase [Lachnospiraceae bacterium]